MPLVLVWRNHPEIRRFMLTQHEISLTEHARWFETASKDLTRRLLIVEENENPFGFINFSGISRDAVANWGFYAAPDMPKGTGRKLGNAAMEHAFGTMSLHKVCGQALDFNLASINLHLKLGFVQEGRLREQHKIDDKYHDLICFGLLSQDWLAAK